MVQRKALYGIGLVAFVVAVMALTVLSLQPSNESSSLSSDASSFRLLKIDEVVPYDAECAVLGDIGHSCPTKATDTNASSLREVELVSYQRTDYYAGNFSVGPFSAPSVTYLQVWFTNSTVFCISPSYDNHATCPVSESLPVASW